QEILACRPGVGQGIAGGTRDEGAPRRGPTAPRPGGRVARGGPVVTAAAVVVAANTPVNDLFALHTKQAPYLTYAVGLAVPRGAVARGLYWDTLNPYHYVRLQTPAGSGPAGRELLIVGGEDHETGQADDQAERYARL